MLNVNDSVLMTTRNYTLSTSVPFVDEGNAMVGKLENGKLAISPSTGVGNEAFVGFSIQRGSTPTVVPNVERFVVPATGPYTITTSKSRDTASGLGVFLVDLVTNARTPLTAGSAANATEYSVAGNVITVNSAQAGKTVEVLYRYPISLAEAMLKFAFDAFQPATASLEVMGVISEGEVYTDRFEFTSDWNSWVPGQAIKLGAGGVVTLGGTGTAINAIVVQVPGVGSGMLGLMVQPS